MSIFYVLMIGSNLINLNIRVILTVFGLTLPINLAYVQIFCEFTLILFLLLTLIEITWIKYLYKFVWKSVRSIDEGLIVTCCTLINATFSSLLSVAWIKSGGGKLNIKSITGSFDWHFNYRLIEVNPDNYNYFR